jgi:hypothetical protein
MAGLFCSTAETWNETIPQRSKRRIDLETQKRIAEQP